MSSAEPETPQIELGRYRNRKSGIVVYAVRQEGDKLLVRFQKGGYWGRRWTAAKGFTIRHQKEEERS